MYQKNIKLSAEEEVREFVRAANRCDFDVDLGYNRVVVDAKSILGVFSLDLNQPLVVNYQKEDPEFERVLQQYVMS
ncbi:HPr family phosphocarrier protein [Cuneatibacter caecimuris]|uniref:PTS HPr component family protein n=1 Tax=Cuneatibacter caecimuris TaxID=1796618 RepID=A0A4Q7P0G8_9FIRM|nr:HPr family phosphocarrier protein [Cuneatibacter caecimuris]RZS92132.1 PTS HPr component family protein [Cuneatibacter caecimuris]